MYEYHNTIQFPLNVLTLFGFYSKENSIKDVVFKCFFCGMLLIFDCVVVLQFWYTRNISDFITNVEAFFGFTQAVLKMVFTAVTQEKLDKMLNDFQYFWTTDIVTERRRSKLDTFMSNVARAQKFFTIVSLLAGSIMNVDALVHNSLPLGSWNMNTSTFWFKLFLICEVMGIIVGSITLPAFDNIFLGISTNIIVQFRILCHRISNLFSLRKKHSSVDMKSCIEHHIFLLKFVESMQEYFSPLLLVQYLTTTPVILGEVYMLFESENVSALLRHGTVATAQILQFSFYCITGEYVSSEAEAVAEAMYFSEWYKELSPALRRSSVLTIQRAYRKVVFRANGLIAINISTFVAVLRATWSICNLVRAIRN